METRRLADLSVVNTSFRCWASETVDVFCPPTIDLLRCDARSRRPKACVFAQTLKKTLDLF
jgi:hypothetical protein